ncbi:MAG: ferrochelatase [Oligoflexia bacterium]|nr:ferrochelatase [Oligoflexia bacterium]
MESTERIRHKTKVVLVQLGSPKSPKVSDVRSYLKEFLGDPRVVDINPLAWKIILNCFVLPFRPKRSAQAYSRIWDGQSFPLITITESMAKKVGTYLDPEKYEVNHAFLLSYPRIKDVWDSWEEDLKTKDDPANKILAIAMFPQYSESTVASGMDLFAKELSKRVKIPPFEFLTDFHLSHAFIDNSVNKVNEFLAKFKSEGKPSDELVISFHGIPKRRVIYKGDVYYQHCYETFFQLKKRITEISHDKIHMTFQSRFGSEEWLTPYTDEYCVDLVEKGSQNIAVYCPAFVADCLETIDEIGTELGEELEEVGGHVQFIPCLNDDEQWCKDFAKMVEDIEERPKERKHLIQMKKEDYKEMEPQKMKSPPLSDNAKKSLKIVFLTLFLDLVGFSIIFPLFPALAKHYLEVDSQNYFLQLIFGSIERFTSVGGGDISAIVLFGGALGAIYSFLQFVAAPIWGTISDRIGRRPVLIVSVFGLALSYLLWFFSGSFTLLIIARFIGGIMGGNISTATAVVGDVTTRENRSKGMATIGIAFALGFIIGPALGGISSLWDISATYPALKDMGVNPFSLPAAIAFILSMFNVIWLYRKFDETLPEEKRGKSASDRSINPLVLFKPLPYKGVNLTNFGHFLFLMAFSGMEFTLTFLAAERLGYSSMDNAYMFIFIGFLIAMTQGGYVRRKAGQIGEKRMALQGLVFLIPGLVAIGYASSSWMLYFGLFFLSVGSSMIIPCLTSLISLYTPGEYQGKSVGIFRSLGALARVLGPIIASIVYWKYGSQYPYYLGAIFLIIPIVMVAMLPKPSTEEVQA